jgi:exonuclease SbcC
MLLVGPNGAGKSAILQACVVGILGYEPKLGRTPASVAQLASGREMSVELETAGKFVVHRTFKMNQGMVSTSVWVSPYQGEKNLADAHRRILEEVGDFAVAFDLNVFLSLSDAKKRTFLFGLSQVNMGKWDKARLKGQLIQVTRAPVSSLTLHAWIDKAFSIWSDRLDLQSNLDRMLLYLKKEYSLWSLKQKEGIAAARRMIASRNQDTPLLNESGPTRKKIEEIREQIVQIREEMARDETRRKNAEGREAEIEQIRMQLAQWHLSSVPASIEEIQRQLSTLRSETFDRAALEKEADQLERETVRLRMEIDAEEKKWTGLKMALETEERHLIRAGQISGKCPVVEGVDCPVDFSLPMVRRQEQLSKQKTILADMENEQKLRSAQYRAVQERQMQIEAILDSRAEDQKKKEAQIAAWGKMLKQQEEGETERESARRKIEERLARLEAEALEEGGYADPDDLTLQKEGLERQLEEKKALLSEQEAQRSIWIAYQQNQVEIKKANANVDALKKLIGGLGPKGLQGEVMKEMIRPFSKIVNDLLHSIDPEKELVFRFQDARGNEIFEMGWQKGERFIPFEALSTGERVLFSAALMTGLIIFREPRCRLLLVDNLESVDLHHRRQFLRALSAFVDQGHLDHFIAAGVEGIPEEEGAGLGLKIVQMASPVEGAGHGAPKGNI